MASSIRWGALLVASVVCASGCSRPPEAPASPPGPAPALQPDASPLPPSLGAPVEAPADPLARFPGKDILPDRAGAPAQKPRTLSATLLQVRYGRGLLSLRYFPPWDRTHCPLAGSPPGCLTYALSTPAPSPDEAAWNSTDGALAAGATRARQAPRAWAAVAGGRRALYALSPDDRAIDRIDEQGNVTTFVEDERIKDWNTLRVFERGERVWFLGQSTGNSMIVAEALPTATPGPPRRLTGMVDLEIVELAGQADARSARHLASSTRRVMAGEPGFMPLDGNDNGRWAMAWLEVIPPDYGAPLGHRGAKNGCGRRSHGPSRPLSDPSVQKKAHITVIDGTSVVSDTVAWSNDDLEPTSARLLISLDQGKPVVALAPPSTGPTAPRASSMNGPHRTPEQIELTRDEALLDASFDREAGEGLVALWGGEQLFTRRVDASGKFLGEAAAYGHPVAKNLWAPRSLRRFRGRWLALSNDAVLPLTEGSPPQHPAPQDHRPLALVVDQDHLVLLTIHMDILYSVALDEHGKRTGGPRKIAAMPKDWDSPSGVGISQPQQGAPLLGLSATEHAGQVRVKVGSVELRPGSSWSWPLEIAQHSGAPYAISFHEVSGDLVATLSGGPAEAAVWLRAGKITSTPLPPKGPRPLLIPPADPGPLAAVPGLAGAACHRKLPTVGPTTLLVCVGGADPLQPGTRVSLRAWPPPDRSAP